MTSDPAALPPIRGFDRSGEPELRREEGGALALVFNALPPVSDSGRARSPEIFEGFEAALSAACGARVMRDDRETFLVEKPAPDTAARLADYLSRFWKAHAPALIAAEKARPVSPDAPFQTLAACDAKVRLAMARAFAPYGLKPLMSAPDPTVKAKTATGSARLWAWVAQHSEGPRLSLSILVSIDALEKLHALATGMSEAERRGRWSAFLQGRLAAGFDMTRVVLRPRDVDAWADVCASAYPGKIEAAIAKAGDPAHLEAVLNGRVVDPLFADGDHETEVARRGVLLAALLGREDLPAVIARHRMILAAYPDPPGFEAVRAFVAGKTPESLRKLATAPRRA